MTLKRRIELLERLYFPDGDRSDHLFTWPEFSYWYKNHERSDNLPPGSKVLVPPAYRRLVKRMGPAPRNARGQQRQLRIHPKMRNRHRTPLTLTICGTSKPLSTGPSRDDFVLRQPRRRAHGVRLVTGGKKGMQGKETVGVLPSRYGEFAHAHRKEQRGMPSPALPVEIQPPMTHRKLGFDDSRGPFAAASTLKRPSWKLFFL